MAENGHMGAQLVLPAGDRLERDEGDPLPGPVHHRIMGHRRLRPILLAGPRFAHAVALGPRRFDQSRLDLALGRLRHAVHQRPIDLPHRAGLEGAAELGRDRRRLATTSTPEVSRSSRWTSRGRVSGPSPMASSSRSIWCVVLVPPCTAMPERLVEHQQIVVLVQGDGGEEVAVGLRQCVLRRWRRRRVGQRRHANGLAFGEPRARLGPAAVDPHLARAQQLLEPAMRQAGIMGLEPAVEPHAVFAGANFLRLYPCHDVF